MTSAPGPAGTRTLDVGVGDGSLASADMVLNIGPQHPATHGVLRLRVALDGERIVSADPVVGYMHRGAEKLFEVRDYRQITVLANRHDWLSAFGNELGVVLGVEAMLGMEVPERATWARTLLAELNRVLNHLMFLGSYPLELGAMTPIFYSFREREEIQAVMEEISGGRMHFMFNRVGGLKEDLPAGWLDRVTAAVAAVRGRMPQLEALLVGNEILEARTRGVGVLPSSLAEAYGVSGPIARASGVDLDLRRDAPYLAYGELFDEGKLDQEDCVFLQLATPSRERVEEYKILRNDIDLLVGRINSASDTLARPRIAYRHTSVPRSTLAAMYQIADIMIVTPLRDGMNLVAKEYLACRDDDNSALILSEFAGAALELDEAYMINPYDIDGMKATIMKAINDSPQARAQKMRAMRQQVFAHTIDDWADSFLTELGE